ncbi:MAG: lysophospholipid acyltransferase family protein [Ignavibacteria bacterium]|nr:lysophospholipid acyltransferase family protein [Ignavibacteria bacterium]
MIFVSGHISNWELMAYSFPEIFEGKVNLITKIQASKGLNKIINEYRSLSGNEMIEIGFSLKKVFEKLKKNEFIGFLVDQSAHPDYSAYIDFFGHKTTSFSGPAKIFLKQRPEMLLGYFIRKEDYSYVLKFEKIYYEDIADNNDENIKLLTQRMQNGIESIIRNNPGQWLWFHKRFKHMKN